MVFFIIILLIAIYNDDPDIRYFAWWLALMLALMLALISAFLGLCS